MSAAGVGAECVPTPEHIRTLVERLASDAENAIRSEKSTPLDEVHNRFTAYVSMALLHGTGHRFCRDPFADPLQWSLAGQIGITSDKVATPRHENRIYFIPDTCVELVKAYVDHLDGLSRRLYRLGDGPRDLAHAIRHLLVRGRGSDRHRVQRLPFLFFVDETLSRTRGVNERSFRTLVSYWDAPSRAHRYLVESDLLADGISQPFVDIQLGHLPILSHPLGRSSAISPEAAGNMLRPALERILHKQGWRTIRGLGSRGLPPVSFDPILATPRVHDEEVFGADKRRADRAKRLAIDDDLVETIVRERYPDGIPASLSREATTELRDALVAASASAPERIGTRVVRLLQKLQGERRRGKDIALPGSIRALLGEASPFSEHFGVELDQAQALRDAFIAYLGRQGRESATVAPHRRLAEICVSAAVFGSLIDPQVLPHLPAAVATSANVSGAQLHLKIRLPLSCRPRDWIADPVTTALIHGYLRLDPPAAHASDTAEILIGVGGILSELGFASGAHPEQTWGLFCDRIRPYWQARLPGHLFAVATGAQPTTPLPERTCARILSDLPLAAAASEPIAPVAPTQPSVITLATIRVAEPRKRAQGDAARLFDALAGIFAEIFDLPAVGKNRRNSNRKASLIDKLQTHLAGSPYARSVSVVANWLLYLCAHGTRFKGDLAFDNTILPYFRSCARPLLAELGDTDLLDCDDAEFVHLYSKVLATRGEPEPKRELARLLREFHFYLSREWGAPTLDWSELGVDADDDDPDLVANANILSPTEYRHTLALLRARHPGEHGDQLCGLVILGYRFGMRISEAIRVAVRDIHIDEETGAVCIEIQPGIQGDLKSDAARRVTPSLGRLDDLESGILKRLVAARHADLQQDELVGVFDQGHRQTIDRSAASSQIHAALREATGDPSVRFHHLRHSFATVAYLTLLWPELAQCPFAAKLRLEGSSPSGESWREFLCGSAEIGPDILRVLEAMIGHAAIGTSLGNYIHATHLLIGAIASACAPKDLTDASLSYALGIKRITLTQQRLRAGVPNHDPLAALDWDERLRSHWGCRLGKFGDTAVPPPEPVLTVLHIDQVLTLASRNFARRDRIAETLGYPGEAIRRAIHCAIDLEYRSGYSEYGLDRLRWANAESSEPAPSLPPPLTPNLRTVVEQYAPRLARLPDAIRRPFVDAWCECLHHAAERNRWVLRSPRQLPALVSGLEAMGVSSDFFTLVEEKGRGVASLGSDDAIAGEINRLLESLPRQTTPSLPRDGRRHGAGMAIALGLLEGAPYPRRLDRAIFLGVIHASIYAAPLSTH